uniref:Inositol-tetrakisphosphate 1-kinase n=1 Tax=Corvus moneduloides TaxID=1196302 RepID=A0A8C3D8C3_CORMO
GGGAGAPWRRRRGARGAGAAPRCCDGAGASRCPPREVGGSGAQGTAWRRRRKWRRLRIAGKWGAERLQQHHHHHHRGRAAAAAAAAATTASGHGGELGGGVRACGRCGRAAGRAAAVCLLGWALRGWCGERLLSASASCPPVRGRACLGCPPAGGCAWRGSAVQRSGRGAAPAAGNRLILLSLLLFQPSLGRRRVRASAALPRRPGRLLAGRHHADLPEGEAGGILAEREEDQETEFPGLRRAVPLDLTKPIEDQGPLDVIIHKLTDVILEADQNDSQSLELVQRFQEYIDAHPETIILDPLPAIRTLLDRSKSYELIRQIEAYMQDERICSPPFMELTSACGEDTLQLIEKNGLAFPFICKTRVAHGTNSHEMAIIFNQEGLKAVRPPCVIQSFINHNAVLYKVFVVGESYTVVKRPSLKNFSAGISDRESIFFNSHNVSKPESSSVLTALDKIEGVFERPNDDVIREISKALRQALGVSLFGIDIIINNQTGQHAVIDINAFPGYEGVSEFFTDLLNHIAAVLQGQVPEVTQLNHSKLLAEQSGGIMDERICCASTGCLSVMGKDSSWIVESETNSSVKLQHQRLGCNSAVSPSFQQHCVATLATKASSQ